MPRFRELFPFEILRRVLGADVTLHDDGSKRAMVDGLLTMPCGDPRRGRGDHARHALARCGCPRSRRRHVRAVVIEVNQPDRHRRRRRGKSDRIDAEMAARSVLAGDATAVPKAGDGPVEALRQLRLARTGAMKARTAAANQLHSVCDTAPDQIRSPVARAHDAPQGQASRRVTGLAIR